MNAPLQETDQCVLCGLCLPHCPTFALSQDEAESPRGRISLIQALARGQLPADASLRGHLDRCLVCRACEDMCPSGVPYGKLIDGARALIAANHARPPVLQRLLDAVADKPGTLRPLARRLRLYQRSGAQWLARRSGLLDGLHLKELEALLPAIPAQDTLDAFYPAEGKAGGAVALFTGCLSETLDGEVLHAAIRLLNRLGYDVHVPPAQACCGALHQHNGEPETARALGEQNRTAFQGLDVEAVLGTASGCTAQLYEQQRQAHLLPAPVLDVTTFLARLDGMNELPLRPLHKRVAVHEPCSSRHVLRDRGLVSSLLERIPGIELTTLTRPAQCCGAAGSHLITQPGQARALRRPLLDEARQLMPDILVSHNLGCALHLAAGMEDARIVHPLLLLAEQAL